MKSIVRYSILIIPIIIYISCSHNIAEKEDLFDDIIIRDFEDLFQKYNDTIVVNCEELLLMAADMTKIYKTTIKRAEKGNKRAKSDLFDLEIYRTRFDSIASTINTENCEIELKKWKEDFQKIISENEYKIDSIFRIEDTLKYIHKEIDDSILINLQRLLTELQEDSIYTREIK